MALKKLGRYDLIRVLGKGAMGLVYEGYDPNLHRRVAIKTIKVENLSEEAATEYEVRFRTEARSAARLQHPHIVSVYDSDRDGDTAFLVMEFIQGDDLKHHLDKGERHTLEQTLGIMGDLLSALDYAHRQNIVHRDIKPANLLIEANGRVKLTDFGVARIQDSGDATRTQGSMVGTLKYMSPEQVQGQPIDSRADLFAAGIVLYQLLTGKRPFDGDSDFAIIQQIVAQNPAAPSTFNPKLPPAIDAVVARALAKSRDQRFSNGQEFAAALQAVVAGAYDPTMVAPAAQAVSAASSTWTGTVRPGESLVDTHAGTSGSGTSASVVTQELELVYWKDVKDSTDVEDLQGFLARFPTGIYSDLAGRRLRKLGLHGDHSGLGSQSGTGAGTQAGSGPGTGTGRPVVTAAATPADKTMLLLADGSQGRAVPTPDKVDSAWDALGEAAEQASAPAPLQELVHERPPVAPTVLSESGTSELTAQSPPPAAAVSQPTPAPASRRLAWVLAGTVLLAGAGLVFRQMSASDAPAARSAAQSPAQSDAPADSASAAMAIPWVASSAAAQAAAAQPATPAASVAVPLVPMATPGARLAASVATASATPASAAAAARKAALEKERLAKQALVKAAVTVAAPEPVRGEHTAPSPSTTHPPVAAPAPVVAATPRQACEDRKLFGFQTCMTEQCAKPVFANTPECVERRRMEQSRRDELLRR